MEVCNKVPENCMRGVFIYVFRTGEHEFEVEIMIQGHLGSPTDLDVKTEKSQKPQFEVLEVKMEVNDLRSQSDQSLGVQHGLIDICTKFQVPISFLAAKHHNIVFMQKSVRLYPAPLSRPMW